MANNTVASGYLEYPFVNLLVALAWSQAEMRAPEDVMALPPEQHAVWLE